MLGIISLFVAQNNAVQSKENLKMKVALLATFANTNILKRKIPRSLSPLILVFGASQSPRIKKNYFAAGVKWNIEVEV